MKAKFSIRYKFLMVTTSLLVTCVGTYLALAATEFKSDKQSLVFDYNLSLVSNIASDLESFFANLSSEIRMVAYFSSESHSQRNEMIADFMKDQKDLVFIAGSERFTELNKTYYSDPNFTKTYGLEDDFFIKKLSVERAVPYQKIQIEGQSIWNATIQGGPPLIGIGRSIIEEDSRGVPVRQFAVIGYVRADRLINSLKQGKSNEVYVATTDGRLLVHTNPEIMSRNEDVHDPLVELARKATVKRGEAEFADQNRKFLGAYYRAYGDRVLVLSKIPQDLAFAAVNKLIFRSLLFASMIVTLAFLAAIFFSRSLTRPIDTLMRGMGRVSEGDLTSHIHVQSRDEISLLAASFNRMITDLKNSREELESINRELESKVKERTHELELQNLAVKEAQEALLRTTRLAAVGEVAGLAAHEVLNPLTSIISRLNKVKNRVASERSREAQVLIDINSSWEKDFTKGGFQQLVKIWNEPSKIKTGARLWDEDIDNIKRASQNILDEFKSITEDTDFLISESERIGRIVSSFRSLSAARGEPKEASVHALCERSIKIMADLAQRDQIKIECALAANLDRAMVDDDEFIQVMTNLIRNSLQSVNAKFNGSGQGWLRISSRLHDEQFEIHLEDNGLGIKEENVKRLFEKNFTTKSKAEGTGIGLSISRRIIRAFHGDLKLLKSEAGEGAHFIILLPLSKKNRSVA